MFDYNEVYWSGSIFQVTVMIALLGNIWRRKTCFGFSLRSQILYALVFSTRHLDLGEYYVPPENVAIKVLFLIVTYGAVLSMLKCFAKTYDKQNDQTRIDIWIFICLVLSFILVDRFDFYEITMVFSIYLEVVAMVPQFQLTLRTKRIDKNVNLYITLMAIYSFAQLIDFCERDSYFYRKNRYPIVAATIQFLLYCDFFRRIYPLIVVQDIDNDDQSVTAKCRLFYRKIHTFLSLEQSEDITNDVENATSKTSSKTGYLASNVSNVVLTPSSLAGVHKDKVSLDI